MKRKPLRKAGLLVIAALMLVLSGCGVKVDISVNKDMSVDLKSQYFLTEEEVSRLTEGLGAAMVEEPFRKVTIDGRKYCRVMQNYEHYKPGRTQDVFTEINEKYALVTGSNIEDIEEDVQEQNGNSLLEGVSSVQFADASVTFSYPVYYTNGNVRDDGRTVDFNLLKVKEGEPLYAVFDQEVYREKTVEFSGVENGGVYNKYKNVKINTKGVIKKVFAEEKKSFARENEMPVTSDGYKNWYFGADGVYSINVRLINGKKAKADFTIDTTRPTTNIKNKTYRKSVKIVFSDKNSGMKSARLNGKTIKSGKRINRAGKYKLVLTDRAGNKKTVQFKIR